MTNRQRARTTRGRQPRIVKAKIAGALQSVLMVSLLLCLGCGYKSGLERVHVSGKASYRDQPIEIGQIRFVPIESTQGPITIEQIRDGHYTTKSSGGVPVGKHRVEVLMYDAEEYRNTPRIPGAPAVAQRLPARYNRDSELTLTIESGSRAVTHDVLLVE